MTRDEVSFERLTVKSDFAHPSADSVGIFDGYLIDGSTETAAHPEFLPIGADAWIDFKPLISARRRVWSLRADGSVNRDDDKAGFWKCPYHNGRMCMEIIERVASLSK